MFLDQDAYQVAVGRRLRTIFASGERRIRSGANIAAGLSVQAWGFVWSVSQGREVRCGATNVVFKVGWDVT